jgi:hypothetical protein
MPRPVPLARILAEDPALAAWVERQRLCDRVTAHVRGTLPRALAPLVRVASCEEGRVELAAQAGAVAAALRQRGPAILAALRREGWDFTEVRVRVQVGGARLAPGKSATNQRDASGARALFGLASALPEGPLRASLERWSRRARGRSGRSGSEP